MRDKSEKKQRMTMAKKGRKKKEEEYEDEEDVDGESHVAEPLRHPQKRNSTTASSKTDCL